MRAECLSSPSEEVASGEGDDGGGGGLVDVPLTTRGNRAAGDVEMARRE